MGPGMGENPTKNKYIQKITLERSDKIARSIFICTHYCVRIIWQLNSRHRGVDSWCRCVIQMNVRVYAWEEEKEEIIFRLYHSFIFRFNGLTFKWMHGICAQNGGAEDGAASIYLSFRISAASHRNPFVWPIWWQSPNHLRVKTIFFALFLPQFRRGSSDGVRVNFVLLLWLQESLRHFTAGVTITVGLIHAWVVWDRRPRDENINQLWISHVFGVPWCRRYLNKISINDSSMILHSTISSDFNW